jgi:predicted alpha/beta hydrolase family esterase
MKLEQKLLINYFSAKLNMLAMVSKKKAAETAFELFCTPMRRSKKLWPSLFKKAEETDVEVAGYTIHAYRWRRDNALKALIVHGFESSSANFEKYISGFIAKGYEVVAFDAPAHGRSTGKTINLPAYVAVIEKISEMYGPFSAFLAHSYGGIAVTHYLEKVRHETNTRIVLIAPATETTTTIDSFFKYLHLGKDVRKEFDKVIYDRGGYWPDHYSIRRAVNTVYGKILWFHDEDDQLTPLSDALKVKGDEHPNIEFRITKGFGHSRIYRDAGVLKQALDFFQ